MPKNSKNNSRSSRLTTQEVGVLRVLYGLETGGFSESNPRLLPGAKANAVFKRVLRFFSDDAGHRKSMRCQKESGTSTRKSSVSAAHRTLANIWKRAFRTPRCRHLAGSSTRNGNESVRLTCTPSPLSGSPIIKLVALELSKIWSQDLTSSPTRPCACPVTQKSWSTKPGLIPESQLSPIF